VGEASSFNSRLHAHEPFRENITQSKNIAQVSLYGELRHILTQIKSNVQHVLLAQNE
jgi:hypothetical protein